MTKIAGKAIRPANATSAPARPNQRRPYTIEALPMFGPGRNWQSATTEAKSSGVTQRRSSIIPRCAQGMTPPNARAPIMVKPTNNSPNDFGGVGGASDTPVIQAFRQGISVGERSELGVLGVCVQ